MCTYLAVPRAVCVRATHSRAAFSASAFDLHINIPVKEAAGDIFARGLDDFNCFMLN